MYKKWILIYNPQIIFFTNLMNYLIEHSQAFLVLSQVMRYNNFIILRIIRPIIFILLFCMLSNLSQKCVISDNISKKYFSFCSIHKSIFFSFDLSNIKKLKWWKRKKYKHQKYLFEIPWIFLHRIIHLKETIKKNQV